MERKDIDYLTSQGFPPGLISALTELKKNCAEQIFVLDNSEPMNEKDGHVFVDGKGFQECTRWEELSACVKAHIRLSGAFSIRSSFLLLNAPAGGESSQRFDISCDGKEDVEVEEFPAPKPPAWAGPDLPLPPCWMSGAPTLQPISGPPVCRRTPRPLLSPTGCGVCGRAG